MPPQRKVDLVLDSVKRLLRVGATANLSNLLQKQHPADLAQIFGELPERDRLAAFAVLVERNSRLAMETLSELGPEAARATAGRPLRRGDCQAGPGAALGRCGGHHRQPARRTVDRRARVDGPERIGRGREPPRIPRADGGPHHEPACLRAGRRHDGRRGHHSPAELARCRDGVLPLHRRRPTASRGRDVAASPAARVAGNAAEADHGARTDQRPRRHGSGRSRAPGRIRTTCWPFRSSTKRTSSSASSPWTTSSTSSRMKRPKTSIAWPACRATSGSLRRQPSRCASGCRGSSSIWRRRFSRRRSSACFQHTIAAWVALAVFMPDRRRHGRKRRDADADRNRSGHRAGELTWSNSSKALVKELLVGIGNGLVTGLIAAVVAWVMNGDFRLGIILAMAMVINLFVAGLVGHADSARSEGPQDRSGARLGRLHHDVYRRLRVCVLPGTRHPLHAVLPTRRVE